METRVDDTDEEHGEEERKKLIVSEGDDGEAKPPDSDSTADAVLSQESYSRPKDAFNSVYAAFILIAIGLLFPWNTFVLAIDYFRFLYPDKHVENVIPYTVLLLTLLTVTISVGVVKVIPFHLRIFVGYCTFILVLLLVPLVDIGIHNCTISTDVGFSLTVIFVAFIAIGGGAQQSCYYGLAGMLPPRYTQALMLGESAAGVVVSILRIITKASVNSERVGAIAFFLIGLVYIILCVFCQWFVYRSKFVKYYVKQSSHMSSRHTTDKNEDDKSFSKSFRVGNIQTGATVAESKNTWRSRIPDSLSTYYRIVGQIWKVALSVFVTLAVTLLLFPGLSSDIQRCDISDWPPVITATVFNVFDMFSRIFVFRCYKFNSNALVIASFTRLILIPFFVLCVSPSPGNPVFQEYSLWIGIVLVAILGLTNGSLATISMVKGPMCVATEDREVAGTMMVFFILSGLTLGSVLATALTPLTELEYSTPCTNITAEFLCKHNNDTFM